MGTEWKPKGRETSERRARLVHKLELYGVLAIVMMFVIFAFSSMDGDVSTSQSNGIAFWLAGRFIDGFDSMTRPEQLAAIHSMTYPIRKTAHVTEYALLGGLLAATFWQAVRLRGLGEGKMPSAPFGRAWALGFACAVLYACTDEFHQTFTPGRTGQPIDVCIDAVGILVGTLVVMAFIYRHTPGTEQPSQEDEEA